MTPRVIASRSSAALLPEKSSREAAPAPASPVWRARFSAVCWRPRARPPADAARRCEALLRVVPERDEVEREVVDFRVERELRAEPPLRDEPDLRAEDPDLLDEPPPVERFRFSAISIPPSVPWGPFTLCPGLFPPKRGGDTRVARQWQPPPLRPGDLPGRRRERVLRLDHVESPHQQVVEGAGVERPVQPEAPLELLERVRLLSGTQIEVAPEEDRDAVREVECGLSGRQHLAPRRGGKPRAGVHIHDEQLSLFGAPQESAEHASALGAQREREPQHLFDSPGRPDEQLVGAALVRGDRVGVEPCERCADRGGEVARGESRHPAGPCRLGERSQPPRRRLLQQRYVPFERRDRQRELAGQRPVHLRVRHVHLSCAEEARAQGEKRLVGRMVTPVKEVPSERADYHRGVPRHFLTGDELTSAELTALLDRAIELKRDRLGSHALEGRSVALIFDRPSTRTRISFEVGVAELGGHPVVLREGEMQISRGESVRDTALVLSRYVHAIALRTGPHATVEALAEHADVPVINMLTAEHHPCQALADLMTLRERFGDLAGLRLAYVGDGNNVAHSLMILGEKAGMEVVVATPAELAPSDAVLASVDGAVSVTEDPAVASRGADAVYTDVWVSMGDEAEAARRREVLAPYRLDERLLEHASERAVALHCLPAHPGEEISEGVLYGERSAIWDQAENRLHAQKALLELLVRESGSSG